MKRFVYVVVLAAFAITTAACNREPAATSADALPGGAAVATAPDNAPAQPKVSIPAGTKLRVALLQAVSSDKSRSGDEFLANLMEPVVVDGKTVFAKGTEVHGRVVEAKESGRVNGRASLQLTLTEIVYNGREVSILTKPYRAVAESTKKRDAAVIGGGAGLGAAIGAIAGGKKGAVIGAAAGGGAGTGTVLATKGKEIRFGPEYPVSFSLAQSIAI